MCSSDLGIAAGEWQFTARASGHQDYVGQATVGPAAEVELTPEMIASMIEAKWDVRSEYVEESAVITVTFTYSYGIQSDLLMEPINAEFFCHDLQDHGKVGILNTGINTVTNVIITRPGGGSVAVTFGQVPDIPPMGMAEVEWWASWQGSTETDNGNGDEVTLNGTYIHWSDGQAFPHTAKGKSSAGGTYRGCDVPPSHGGGGGWGGGGEIGRAHV